MIQKNKREAIHVLLDEFNGHQIFNARVFYEAVAHGIPVDEAVTAVRDDQGALLGFAKVVRDRIMTSCGERNPHYGFESHMGYATERHRAAIEMHGPVVRLHRMSFSPFRLASEGAEVVPEGNLPFADTESDRAA